MNNRSMYGGLPFSNVSSVPIPTYESSMPFQQLPFRPAFGSVQTSQEIDY